MSGTIKADGDTWRARLDDPGGEAVVFFCTSTDQRPYRVVRVAPGRFAGDAALDGLTPAELKELFDASGSMGAPLEYPTYP